MHYVQFADTVPIIILLCAYKCIFLCSFPSPSSPFPFPFLFSPLPLLPPPPPPPPPHVPFLQVPWKSLSDIWSDSART